MSPEHWFGSDDEGAYRSQLEAMRVFLGPGILLTRLGVLVGELRFVAECAQEAELLERYRVSMELPEDAGTREMWRLLSERIARLSLLFAHCRLSPLSTDGLEAFGDGRMGKE